MLLYTETITNRLEYMADFAGKQITGNAFELTTDKDFFLHYTEAKINYSPARLGQEEYWIQPHTLLFEQSIGKQRIDCFELNAKKAFFKTAGDFAFDILAAGFYLLSRYEEYLPHEKDRYGRYAHTNSLAYREGFLSQPLINHWLHWWAESLRRKFPSLTIATPAFLLLPSYDIDIAWSYRHKSAGKKIGGLLRSLLLLRINEFKKRINVLRGRQRDPFDSFGWLHQQHEKYGLRPYYFFPVAEKKGRYDKNISPGKKALQELIKDHTIRYPVGLHPSWISGDIPFLLTKEKHTLTAITGNPVVASRQHYIRFTLPATFRLLQQEGIRFDFSMGYGSVNGFRASVATPFYWYDLEKENNTDLLLFPFCFMDANSFYEQQQTAAQALQELNTFYAEVKSVNGMLITIWHNHFLGTDPLYKGWKNSYGQFLDNAAKNK